MFHILVLGNAAMLTRRDRDDLFYYTEGVRQIDYLYTIYTGQGLGKKNRREGRIIAPYVFFIFTVMSSDSSLPLFLSRLECERRRGGCLSVRKLQPVDSFQFFSLQGDDDYDTHIRFILSHIHRNILYFLHITSFSRFLRCITLAPGHRPKCFKSM